MAFPKHLQMQTVACPRVLYLVTDLLPFQKVGITHLHLKLLETGVNLFYLNCCLPFLHFYTNFHNERFCDCYFSHTYLVLQMYC